MPLDQSPSSIDPVKPAAPPFFPSDFTVEPNVQHGGAFGKPGALDGAFCGSFGAVEELWHLPLKEPCLTVLFRTASTLKLASLAKTLPWDDPVARTLDFEVHR